MPTLPSALPPAQAFKLKDLLAVSKGAVVSRTLAKNKAGTLTLMAFDKGEGLSEHSAPFDAYLQVLAGVVKLTIGGKPVKVKADEIVVMPAGVPHAVLALGKAKFMLVMIKG